VVGALPALKGNKGGGRGSKKREPVVRRNPCRAKGEAASNREGKGVGCVTKKNASSKDILASFRGGGVFGGGGGVVGGGGGGVVGWGGFIYPLRGGGGVTPEGKIGKKLNAQKMRTRGERVEKVAEGRVVSQMGRSSQPHT